MTTRDVNPFASWEKKLPAAPLIDRDKYILAACQGCRVIHLGACDAPMTREKALTGKLLHQKLKEVCSDLMGYDNDRESIEFLAKECGITDIHCHDLAEIGLRQTTSTDIVVCADIIEHVSNAGLLMETCNRLLPIGGTLLLSTINALSLKQSVRATMGREPVHPDHVAYYSYATLGRMLLRYDFEMTECRYFAYRTLSTAIGILFSMHYRVAPQSADGILVTARKRQDVS